jgi:hypothetical protein
MSKPAVRPEVTRLSTKGDLPVTTLEDLIGCAGYSGPSRSLEEMEAGIARGARERR